jgi:outer membrane protein OmpA-like peptidoglycan-associated protein
VYDLSPVTIAGEFNPDFSNLDIGLHFKSMPLPFVTPYMADFAGYKIEKGKLSLDLEYKIVDKQLNAQNKLLIDQFTLGEEVENPDAVSLPLSLAIALLKDKDGQIIIDLPLTGSIDDPDFSVGGLLLDAFINLITKLVASPFQAIGSLIGSEEDLSVISFKPGTAEIDAETLEKIDVIAKVLADRPEFLLEIRGTVIEPQDWPAMQEDALLEQLKNRKAKELREEGDTTLAEYIKLSEDDYQRLLADLFFEKFPDLAERSFFGTPTLIKPEMGEFYPVAKKKLAAIIKPDQDKLFILAAKRARNIARYIIQKGVVTNERIFILDGNIFKEDNGGEINTELSLNVS